MTAPAPTGESAEPKGGGTPAQPLSPFRRLFDAQQPLPSESVGHYSPLRIAAIYASLSVVWILFSDRVVAWLARDPNLISRLQTYKGSAFVLGTAGLLAWLVRRDLRQIRGQEVRLRQLNRALLTISECNQMLMRAASEAQLLEQTCRIVVQAGAYRLAWVGYAEEDAAKTVRPIAQQGFDEGYLEAANITWADTERGRGPVGRAIRSGEPCAVPDIHRDPQFAPWREDAAKRGFAAVLALPLRDENRTFGVLAIYAAEADAFPAEEIRLLAELAEDLAFGIRVLRVRAQHREAEEALGESERRFREILETVRLIAVILDAQGRITFCNDFLLELTGWQREEVLGQDWFDLFIPPELKVRAMFLEGLKQNRIPPQYENEILTRQGKRRLVAWNNTVWRDRQGRAVGTTSIGEDITERRSADRALRQSERQLRALAARFHAVREEEGVRIAREVHDQVGQSLTSLNIDIAWFQERLSEAGAAPDRAQVQQRLSRMSDLVRETVGTVQRICAELRPGILDDLGLAAAIEWQAEEFASRTGLRCVVTCESLRVEPERGQATAVFRVFQEVLTNVRRHARATEIQARLKRDADTILLTVTDNGRGISEEDIRNPRSLGLLGMRERALAAGGRLEIVGNPGRGTTVTVALPSREPPGLAPSMPG